MNQDRQLGVADETVYGTPTTPTRFFEYDESSIEAQYARIDSKAQRAGTFVQRADRFTPYRAGAAGDITMEVLTKGFGFWLKHLLGAVATTGPVDSVYTHTGTVADLLGKHFTAQVNRPFHPTGTNQPFTYHGGKVDSFELANSVAGHLMCKLSCDFEDEDTTTALAAASYPATADVFSFAGAAITVGGTALDVTDIAISGKNGLKTDRRKLRSNPLKREPVQSGLRELAWKLTADFESLAQYNRVASDTRAGALAQIVSTWTGPVLAGAAAFPQLIVTIPAGRFDKIATKDAEYAPLEQELSGVVLHDGVNSPITIAYKTTDSTP